jgi:hypothetical protein
MMAEDDRFKTPIPGVAGDQNDGTGQQAQGAPTPDTAFGGGAGAAAAAALAAIASGATIRALEVMHLADAAGQARIPVRSSCIDALSYNLVTGTMTVHFADGSDYDYPDISMVAFLVFANARSVGSHYNTYYRGAAATQWAGSKKQRMLPGGR